MMIALYFDTCTKMKQRVETNLNQGRKKTFEDLKHKNKFKMVKKTFIKTVQMKQVKLNSFKN